MSTIDANQAERHDYRQQAIDKLSGGVLRVQQDATQGAYVVADQPLQSGQILLECPSASIALDPSNRQSHCGYCACPVSTTTESGQKCCENCHLVSICGRCDKNGATQWHSQSEECYVLRSLLESFVECFAEFEGLSLAQSAQHVESIYIITVRLLYRKQLDQQQQHGKILECPLPKIDWRLFDTLYSSRLPTNGGSQSSFATAMASLFQIMNTKLQQRATASSNHPIRAFDPAECIDVWSKCRGCCHAITDLSRPLGAQNIGVALFVPQSFFNHACAPNAFLSCLLPRENAAHSLPCAVEARTVCYAEENVPLGEAVSLSYIPLSGLCRRERQVRLKEGYSFSCNCVVCREASIPNTTGHVLEDAVGGVYAAGITQDEELNSLAPLRELQINCHQQIMAAAAMEPDPRSGEGDKEENNASRPNVDEEDNPRMDLVQQSIATLEMAQRGIRNQKIPSSHEVSLECHRLLAIAYSLLRINDDGHKENDEDAEKEQAHHEQFFQSAKPCERILDPSALAIQHMVMAECLQSRLCQHRGDENTTCRGDIKSKYHRHLRAAQEIAKRALGDDHPFVVALMRQQTSDDASDTPENYEAKKRKLNP